jgi:alpha-galactosidase
MKSKSILLSLLFLLVGSVSAWCQSQDVLISTKSTSLLLKAEQGKAVKIVYYGDLIGQQDISAIYKTGDDLGLQAYPTFGSEGSADDAIDVVHANGDFALDLEVVASGVTRTSSNYGETVKIQMKDKVYPFYVTLCYRSFKDADIIEMWSEISNKEKKDVTLKRFVSGYLPVREGNVWLTHFHGGWANELRLFEEPLTGGVKEIRNRDGVRNGLTDHSELMLSLDGQPRENTGRVIGAALCWSGNYKMSIDTERGGSNLHHFFGGIDEANSEYYLKPNQTFTTPELALTYSSEGKGGVSRNFHAWARHDGMVHNGEAPRDVLLNSWEGVYLSVDEQKMASMMKGISELGGELFVMDDGWFASKKYNRDKDNAALGDWNTDLRKLPNDIGALVNEAKKNNLKFGIWIEPEMSNWKASELYDNHPDWFLQNKGRDPKLGRGRTQAVLDLTNPKVQDFVFSIVDNLMTKFPGIYYMKWDANCDVRNYGSTYLPMNRQSQIYIDYHLGLRKVLERIRAKYPNLVMQACASGGGRVTYGVMPYFDECWTSDDTDAMQRIFIQWGMSHFFPSMIMAAHVSASPNHQTGRRLPLKFRFDVAMTGRLGIEMKPSDFTEEEKTFAKQAVSDYKRLRTVIQQGDLYRLISPYEGEGTAASLMYVAPDKQKAVFFAYKLKHFYDLDVPRFVFAGLDANKNYRLHEINKTDNNMKDLEGTVVSGRVLMNTGIELPMNKEYSSRVIELTAE